jgi:hypothetical protein
MRKIPSVIVVIFLLLAIFSCGCTEKNNEDSTGPKTVYMNAQDFINDFSFSTSTAGGKMTWKLDYKSLNEGDTLILTDKIYNITHTGFWSNSTSIFFDVEDYVRLGVNASEVVFQFEGNMTNEFDIGDNVRITLTVKHFLYTNETSGATFNMDVFEEGWDQEKFMMNFLTQILPKSTIEKI